VVASQPVIGTNIAMSNVSDLLTSGNTDHLLMTLTLPAGAGNSMQNLSSTVSYTFTGTQRTATNK
jgi:spore coat-associated protein N